MDVFPIKIISKQDQNILAEFAFQDLDRAYEKALSFEDLGLDIELVIPGATASLAHQQQKQQQQHKNNNNKQQQLQQQQQQQQRQRHHL